MTRTRRFLLLALSVLLVAVAAVLLAVRVYLSSGRAATAVESHLRAAYGAPVRVEGVEVGTVGSALRGLALFEPGTDTSQTPWAVVEDVGADVSAWDLLRGTPPRHLTLRGAAVTLRFDEIGRLLTRFPEFDGDTETLPEVRIERGRLTLRQDGRPDFVVQDIGATLRPDGCQLLLEGTVTDLVWGEWSLQGALGRKTGVTSLTLKTSGKRHVTQAMLDTLPFVPRAVWQQVQAEGDTPAEITVRFDPDANKATYRVVLEPESTKLRVASIDLTAEQARGRVVIKDHVVRLTGVRGRTAGGELRVNGTLDFRRETDKLSFTAEAEGLDLRRLPERWSLPPRFDGRLSGRADLRLTIKDGVVHTNGEGEGLISDARFAGLPTKEPIRLRLHADGIGFRFRSPQPTPDGGAALPLPVLLATALLAQPPGETSSPATRAVNGFHKGLTRAVQTVLDVGTGLLARLPKASDKPVPPKPGGNYLEATYGLEDAHLDQIVRAIGLKLPFPITGRLSFDIQMAIPLDTPRDLKTYRLKGTAALPRLSLAGLELGKVWANVAYADGVLRLEELRGRVLGGGSFLGSARAELVPQGNLTGRLTTTGVSLAHALQPAGELAKRVGGTVTATGDFQVPLARLQDAGAWRASGNGSATDLRFDDFRVGALRFRWEGADGLLKVSDLHAALYRGDLSGAVVVPLKAAEPGRVELRLRGIDMGALSKDAPALPFRLEGRADGTLEGTIPAGGPGQERDLTVKLDLSAPKLRVQGIPTERLTGTASYRNGGVEYRFQGQSLGGRFHLNGTVPLLRPKPDAPQQEGRLSVEGAQLARLWDAFGLREVPRPLQGTMDLNVAFRHGGPDGAPVGGGRFVLSRVRWEQTELIGQIRGDVRLTPNELRLRDLTGAAGEGLVRGQVAINLRSPERSWFTLDIDRVDASRLLAPWPAWAERIQGPVEARLRGTLGREWTGTGTVALVRGKVLGVDVSEWRMPVGWLFSPEVGRGQIDVRDSSAQLARGRATGRASIGWGLGARLDGQVRFFNLELQTLLRQATDLHQVGSGMVTGRLDFSGNEVRSLDDVTAVLDATLAQTQALELPVLRQIAPYVVPGGSPATSYRSGSLHARLARGVVRVQRLSLNGATGQLFVDGTVTLQGRLSLDVLASTPSLGVNPEVLRRLGLRIPLTGSIPLTLVLEARNYLSSRLVHLRVTGTVRCPTVRVEPLSILTEEALRYFLNRANVPIP